MRLPISIVAATLLVAPAAAQEKSPGEKSFQKCVPCHSVGAATQKKLGPPLNGLEGRTSGTIEGYDYSEANKAAKIVWGEATFKNYIKDPKASMPGNKMLFAGVKDEAEIRELWSYLSQFKADGTKK